MRTRLLVLAAALSSTGCKALAGLLDEEEPNCETRTPFWADTDSDGVGDAGAVYVGCEAPDGYVDVPPDTDADADTDTTSPDTDVVETDRPDTDVPDSDTPDSDAADTD